MASARGEGLDIGIAYVAADDLPKALLPTGRYKVDGTDISMQLYVWKDELKVLETEMTGTTETLDDLVSRIVQAIAGAWKPENPETAES